MGRRDLNITRRGRRFDRDSHTKVIVRGLAVVGLLAALFYLAVKAYDGVPGKSYDYVEASLPEVGNLIPHDPVRLGGKRVGQVSSIGAGGDGRALVRLQLDGGTDLTSDTRILLRANGLLGARYVELLPGRSRRPLAGKVIRGNENTLTYGVTEALDVFDRDTRGALRNMVGELGTGVLGQGRALNEALDQGGDAIVPFQRLIRRVLDQPGALERLLPSLDSALRPLEASRRPLSRLPKAAADGLRPLADEEAAVRGTLREAPSTLAAADNGLSRGRVLLAAARSLAVESTRTLPAAPGGLRAAAALLRESPRPLARARSLLRTARPAVPALLRVTSGASPLLTPLRELFSDLTPISRQVGRYECDIENFGAVFRSMTGLGGFGDGPNGPAMGFRLQVAAPVPTEALSVKDTTGLARREGYVEPCKYLSKPYLVVARPAGAR
jgi:phospholipid/cholesterol/gamma-HCH transport system substrate-binding protein